MQEKIKIMEDEEFREYDLVEICYSKEYNRSYVIYKDKDDYYASTYDIQDGTVILGEILEDGEWDFIDKEISRHG